jgi:glycosyltransferase involved in cell wall biosynthesis
LQTLKRLGVLIAQHPAINHAVILREVRHLREHFEVYTASMRGPDRPVEKLTEEERDEAQRTYFVNPHGVRGALAAHIAALFSRPADYWAGLTFSSKPRYFAYFTQALMVARWIKQNSIEHLHVHYTSTQALLLKRVFPELGISVSFHGPDEFDNPVGFHIREKVQACDVVRAISHYARSQLMKSSDYADWGKIEVVYMGVDPEQFSPRPFRTNPSPVELICVGRLSPVKAQHVLIAAIDRVVRSGRSVLLHVVGGGPDRRALEADVANRGLQQHVIFHGFTPQDKLDQLYQQSDIFVLASFAEGVPGVLMEAMSMEIPCVSTWITGVPELIRNGIDGILVAPSDEEAFATAIMQLADDPQLRERIGRNGRERVLERFHLGHNAERLAGILRGAKK